MIDPSFWFLYCKHMKLSNRFFLLLIASLLSIEAAQADGEKITTFSEELLSKYQGKVVRLAGKYTDRTKLAHAIRSPWGEVVYFHPHYSKSPGKTSVNAKQKALYDSLKEDEHILATGKLYKYASAKNGNKKEAVAEIPDHFYLDESNVKIEKQALNR